MIDLAFFTLTRNSISIFTIKSIEVKVKKPDAIYHPPLSDYFL